MTRQFCFDSVRHLIAVAVVFALAALTCPARAADSPKADVAKPAAVKPAASQATEGKRIQQAKDGTIVLPARDVQIHGTTVRYEPDKNTIGYWFKREDWVSWDLEITTPGTFVLELLQGCSSDSAGSHYTVEIADQKLQDKVQDTGSFHDFRLRKLGELKIEKPGNYTLSVRIDDKPGRAVMDLRAVTLTPPNLKKTNPFKPDSKKPAGPSPQSAKPALPSPEPAKPEK
jgi:hypothetical protein